MDSRFRGNDCYFEMGPLPNDTSTGTSKRLTWAAKSDAIEALALGPETFSQDG